MYYGVKTSRLGLHTDFELEEVTPHPGLQQAAPDGGSIQRRPANRTVPLRRDGIRTDEVLQGAVVGLQGGLRDGGRTSYGCAHEIFAG